MKLILLISALCIAASMAVTQHLALAHDWYWTYPWLDFVMHFAGGALIALIAHVLLGRTVWVVVAALVIGVGWEVYEYGIGLVHIDPDFYLDAVLDLSMDFLGALTLYGMMHLWQRYVLRLTAAQDASPDRTSSSPS